ncbi:ionotropic receptor 25a [Chelonus insularis]|uniref:ionotropic receptor 25a n=1 Tax=Chelonus insularis TaxID=460826 RepID=UPI00158BB127|nr:ionotropic receptor 25a [Chelonus insularis]
MCINRIFWLPFLTIYFFYSINAQTSVILLVVIENSEREVLNVLTESLSVAEKAAGGNDVIKVDLKQVELDRDNVNETLSEVCSILANGVTVTLDMTYTGWDKLREYTLNNSINYIKLGAGIIPYIQVTGDFLVKKNATDVALIFESERELNAALYYLIGIPTFRLVVIDDLSPESIGKIRAMRPSPSYYALYASTESMERLFKIAVQGGIVTRNGIWNLVFTDMNYNKFSYIKDPSSLNVSINVITMNQRVCCKLLGLTTTCDCPSDFQVHHTYLEQFMILLVKVLKKMDTENDGVKLEPKTSQCISVSNNADDDPIIKSFKNTINATAAMEPNILKYVPSTNLMSYQAHFDVELMEKSGLEKLANWTTSSDLAIAPGKIITPERRFFRVGTAYALPWSTIKKDPVTGELMKDDQGKYIWEGYCIDFIKKLAESMKFDYELVIPEDNSFGSKTPDGKWNGLVGDLVRGQTDIVIASLTMTSEREEVIDFVAPYYEQSGIIIVMRKPVRKTSLFKFMTVLKLEVWLSIVGALTLTAIMIWILDKYSPYSSRNNKRSYPYPCREFTLKESFWFALTSFTPQGGGEAPKALSSRTLVAAYWLFVVLMLATFTANLAAFLTVERMQAQVQSLEQLARQSKINYTVVANSSTYQYFLNMRNAEDKLYKVWKEITLNSTSDQVEYRVWDYPIKEQYGHILQTINSVGPVNSTAEGFRKVLESENAEFAFIHDSAEIKYEVTRDCNLTEIGEVFAEQPYAVAVQQGSHLQEEISRTILDLQKNRFFETLSGKYWNSSLKGKCSAVDESEGITLESLGGVFIATLFGLVIAMLTLAGEVLYHRRKDAVQDIKGQNSGHSETRSNSKKFEAMLSKEKLRQLKPAPTVAFIGRQRSLKPRISHIPVYPQGLPFKD